jgi:hypothetical protein
MRPDTGNGQCDLRGGAGYVLNAYTAVWHGWLVQPWRKASGVFHGRRGERATCCKADAILVTAKYVGKRLIFQVSGGQSRATPAKSTGQALTIFLRPALTAAQAFRASMTNRECRTIQA